MPARHWCGIGQPRARPAALQVIIKQRYVVTARFAASLQNHPRGRCTVAPVLANQNTVTPHVWTSRAPNLFRPDVCVFDLDPAVVSPAEVCAAALQLRELLSELGLRSWVKTSGSKGFHIAVPLDRDAEFGE